MQNGLTATPSPVGAVCYILLGSRRDNRAGQPHTDQLCIISINCAYAKKLTHCRAGFLRMTG